MTISFSFSVSIPPPAIPSPGSSAGASGATVLRDKALDPVTKDLLFTNGDQAYVAGMEAIASDLASNWSFVKGEWFLNLNKGVDYWGVIFKKGSSLAAMEAEFRREALATKGVTAITLKLTKLPGRMLDVRAQVTTDLGVFTASLTVNPGN